MKPKFLKDIFHKYGTMNSFIKANLTISYNQLHKYYFVVGLLWGIIMVFLIPPFQANDEDRHYIKTAAISEGRLFCKNQRYFISEEKYNFLTHFGVKEEFSWFRDPYDIRAISTYKDTGNNSVVPIPTNTCSVWPFAHALQAIGILAGNLLGLNELASFFLARLLGLIIALGIVSLAIRTTPKNKHIFIALGLLPMTIFQFSIISYDILILPSQLLFVSFVLYLYERKKRISTKEKIIIAILSVFAISIKPGYIPLLFLLLILKHKVYFTPLKFWNLFLALLFVNAILPILQITLVPQGVTYMVENVVPKNQLLLILKNPLTLPLAILFGIFSNGLTFYLQGFLGLLGWQEYAFHPLLYLVIVITLLFFISADIHLYKFPSWVNKYLIFTFILIFLFLFTLFYLMETTVGVLNIYGVLGRYFIGVIPLLLIPISSRYASLLKTQKQIKTFYFIVFVLMLVIILGVVFTEHTIYYQVSKNWPYDIKK